MPSHAWRETMALRPLERPELERVLGIDVDEHCAGARRGAQDLELRVERAGELAALLTVAHGHDRGLLELAQQAAQALLAGVADAVEPQLDHVRERDLAQRLCGERLERGRDVRDDDGHGWSAQSSPALPRIPAP